MRFELEEYLNENHKTTDKVVSNFQLMFGVKVKQEDNFFLFKYGIIGCNWGEKITHQCRGTIMKFENGVWTCMSRPFNKFWNQHEGRCPIFEEDVFNKRLSRLSIVEKADGSCIQLWHDGDIWRVSTLGTITTMNVQEEDKTFSELFWETAVVKTSKLDKDLTYLFELCCDENRIVTRYRINHAVLLGARNRVTGEYEQNLDSILDHCLNVRLPATQSCKSLGLLSLENVYAYVESESKDVEKYGEYPEGFVLYDILNFPVAKLKNKRYISLHHVGGGDIKHSKNLIVDAVFLGHIDDIYDVLSDRLKAFADGIKQKACDLANDASKSIDRLAKISYEAKNPKAAKKLFAIQVKDKAPKELHGFFFQNADHFMKEADPNISEEFEKWLKGHYQKFDWKQKDD